MLNPFNKYVLHSNLSIIFLIMLNFLRLYVTIFQQTFILNRSDVTPFTKKTPKKPQKTKKQNKTKQKTKQKSKCTVSAKLLQLLYVVLPCSWQLPLLSYWMAFALDLSYLVNNKHFPNNFL